MDLPNFLQPVVHYFLAQPSRFLALAVIGIFASLIFHWWLRKSQTGGKHRILAMIVGGIVAAPLLLSSFLSFLWSLFCFLGGADGNFGSRPTIVAAIVWAIIASAGLLVGLWDVRAGLKAR
jgi:hypothetical protein